MNTRLAQVANDYDAKYRRGEHFHYRPWLFRPFVKALAAKAQLHSGCTLLDAGCGQGFFSGLFAELGIRPRGIDISGEAIKAASAEYASKGAEFEVGDVACLPYENKFDCVFVRGCSLYNSHDFLENREVTEAFLRYTKKGGVLIFDYYSNLCARRVSKSWIYHSVADARKHFSRYPGSRVYFSMRVDTLLLGRFGFSTGMTLLNSVVSRTTGVGGDLVAMVRKT